jgi:hypothetical protein
METKKVYKLFRRDDDGCLHPLFIDTERTLIEEEWEDAWAPDVSKFDELDEGYHFVQRDNQTGWYTRGKPTPMEVVSSSYLRGRWIQIAKDKRGRRRYYDIGLGSDGQVLRFAHRPGWHTSATPSLPAVEMTGKVWAECLIPADDYYTIHRNVSGLSRTHEPIDWYISQKLYIVRVLPDAMP